MRGMRFLGTAALAWAAALVVASLLGFLLAPLSVDQPLSGQELLDWGLRWGAVLAVALASGATLGPRPAATAGTSALVVALTALVVLMLCLVAGGLGVLAMRLGLWGQGWGLPSPGGHGARLAGCAAAEILGLPAAFAGGWILHRLRGRPLGRRSKRRQGDG